MVQIVEQNGVAVVSSRVVANDFRKRPSEVNRKIRDLIGELGCVQNCTDLFVESQYLDSQGKEQLEYLMTRDGFSLLVMGFTGKEALQWKLKYIEAFNKMEEMIKSGVSIIMDSYMIADPIQRAKRWIEEQEERIALEQQNEQLLIETQAQQQEIEHQKQVIMGLTQDSPKPELRQRINQIIRFGARGGYQGRYALAYKEFDLAHHMNVDVRLRRAIERGEVKSNTNRMDYICTHLDMTWQFYQVVARVFEGDLRAISVSIIENTERA